MTICPYFKTKKRMHGLTTTAILMVFIFAVCAAESTRDQHLIEVVSKANFGPPSRKPLEELLSKHGPRFWAADMVQKGNRESRRDLGDKIAHYSVFDQEKTRIESKQQEPTPKETTAEPPTSSSLWRRCDPASSGYKTKSHISFEISSLKVYPVPVKRDQDIYVDIDTKVLSGIIQDVTVVTYLISDNVEVHSKSAMLCDLMVSYKCPLGPGTYSGKISDRVPERVLGGTYTVRNVVLDPEKKYIDCVEFDIYLEKKIRKNRGRWNLNP